MASSAEGDTKSETFTEDIGQHTGRLMTQFDIRAIRGQGNGKVKRGLELLSKAKGESYDVSNVHDISTTLDSNAVRDKLASLGIEEKDVIDAIATMRALPESTQQQMAENYIAELQDDLKWDESFKRTEISLVQKAKLAKKQIADGIN